MTLSTPITPKNDPFRKNPISVIQTSKLDKISKKQPQSDSEDDDDSSLVER